MIEEVLLKIRDKTVKTEIAENPYTHYEVLNLLSKDVRLDVRKAVANNPNTSLETLRHLSLDYSSVVRTIAISKYLKKSSS